MTNKLREQKPPAEQDRELSRELEMTFPASDPLSSTQPGGGVTGPEVAGPPAGKVSPPAAPKRKGA